MAFKRWWRDSAIEVACPFCGAKANRRCVGTVGRRRGIAIISGKIHEQRIDKCLEKIKEDHITLDKIETNNIEVGLQVRSLGTGHYGIVRHVQTDGLLIEWINGNQEKLGHNNTDDIMKWENGS